MQRNMFAAKVMYGLTSKISIWLQASASNHHDSILPKDLANHTHVGNQTIFYSQNPVYGRKYAYQFNGFSFYIKYRFLSVDKEKRHFRMAFYAEGSRVKSAHDEAEPRLMDDNSGYGGGLIVTQLYKRLAVSLTSGYIKPIPYSETLGHDYIKLSYGDAFIYNLSVGYLVYPKKYSSYDQDNYNVYVELMGKANRSAELSINNRNVLIESAALKAGNYVDINFGIQRIINSNARIDFSVKLPLIKQSYVHFYPLYMIAWQRYFYFNSKQRQEGLKNKYIRRLS